MIPIDSKIECSEACRKWATTNASLIFISIKNANLNFLARLLVGHKLNKGNHFFSSIGK